MSVIIFSTKIGPVPIACVMSERHSSEIEITEIPVEFGADITDHAFVLPKKVTLEFVDANAAETYNALVRFQESRVPFTLVTGLSVYKNMLVKSIDADRDATFSKVLQARADLQEIILVGTAYAAGSGEEDGQSKSGEPGGSKSRNAARPTKELARDAATKDRASGTVQRGDTSAAAATPKEQSILKGLLQ